MPQNSPIKYIKISFHIGKQAETKNASDSNHAQELTLAIFGL